jgi:NAD-dependent dihydropyrimidine dehydrogenase PreA subunit
VAKRKIVEIDRDRCNGCGLCSTACAEGALALDAENKAVLIREIFCDGLGACLDVCPTGALEVVEREGEAYDAGAAFDHVLETRGMAAAFKVHGPGGAEPHPGHGGCPGSQAREIPRRAEPEGSDRPSVPGSELSHWPIQLQLVSPLAPYFRGSDLLVAADCTAFALGGFHGELLKGKKLVIACPKLDETGGYVEKLAELIKTNKLLSLTVAIMTVPCCSGLERIVRLAVARSGVPLDVNKVVIGIDGRIASRA